MFRSCDELWEGVDVAFGVHVSRVVEENVGNGCDGCWDGGVGCRPMVDVRP